MKAHVSLHLTGDINKYVETPIAASLWDVLMRAGVPEAKIVIGGKIACPAFSVAFYGLDNNSVVHVINSGEIRGKDRLKKRSMAGRGFSTETVDRMRALFNDNYADRIKDPEAVFDTARFSLDPTTSRECARVRDLFRLRIESNPQIFSKIMHKYSLDTRSKSEIDTPKPIAVNKTIVPQKSAMPSTDILP